MSRERRTWEEHTIMQLLVDLRYFCNKEEWYNLHPDIHIYQKDDWFIADVTLDLPVVEEDR